MNEGLFAEKVNYWKTSRSSDSAINEAIREIQKAGGVVLGDGFLNDQGKAAWMMQFRIGGDVYRSVWPVLRSKSGDFRSAKIQAAVAMKHDIKAKCVAAKFIGFKQSFARERLLPDGKTIGDVSDADILKAVPQMLLGSPGPDVVEGEYE